MKGLHDAVVVGLSLGLIYAFMFFTISRIFTRDAILRGEDVVERLEAERHAALARAFAEPSPEIVLPQERRARPARVQGVSIDWGAASPEERAQAALDVLPLHADDDNGMTARSVAHRLGLDKPQRVGQALNQLRKDGRATSRWQRKDGRRVYWRATP